MVGVVGGFGEEPGDGGDGVELGARNPRGSGEEVLRLGAPAAQPREFVVKLGRVLRDQVAELDQRLHSHLSNGRKRKHGDD